MKKIKIEKILSIPFLCSRKLYNADETFLFFNEKTVETVHWSYFYFIFA